MKTGVIKEFTQHMRDYNFELVCGAVGETFPSEFEIPRENTGTLKDQGYISACVAEVIAQLAEHWYKNETGDAAEMSEGFIYGALRNESSTGEGMIVSVALDLWMSIGTLPKKYFDVLEEMPEIKKIVAKFPEFYELASKYKLKGYVSLNYNKQKKEAAIKTALMQNNCGLLAVSNDGFPGGAHCIILTGWNDEKGTYKFKNSWGASYGDNGFSEIVKSEINAVYQPIFNDIELPFTDVPKDAWYYKDVKNMYFSGLMNGTSPDTFSPDKPLTRAEAAALFNRYAKETDKRFDIMSKVLNC